MAIDIHICTPIFVDFSQYFIKWRSFFPEYPSFSSGEFLSIHPENEIEVYQLFGNDVFFSQPRVLVYSVELLKVKCLPVLLYGLEAYPISNKQFSRWTLYWTAASGRYFVQGLLKLCKIVCWYFNCMSMQECVAKRYIVNVNFVQIMLNIINQSINQSIRKD